MAATPQGLGYYGGGDLVVVSSNPHPSVGRLEVGNEFGHCIFRSCSRWVAHQYIEMVALNYLAHHPVMHLVLKEALFPTEFSSIHFSESLKLCVGVELVSLWVIFIEDLGRFIWSIHTLWNRHLFLVSGLFRV